MPSMQDGGGVAGSDAPLVTMEQAPMLLGSHDSAVSRFSSSGTVPQSTDKNGNSIPAFAYADIKVNRKISNPDVETGSGAARRPPPRKLSLGDLHIRSRDNDRMSGCREIRTILRQLRDSLDPQPRTGTSAGPADSADSTEPDHGEQEPTPRPSDVEMRPRPDRSAWRHCRFSLPARLRPRESDGLGLEDGVDMEPGRVARRRMTCNVRFADEMGMNLNTFAMIPSSRTREDSPSCLVLPWVIAGETATVIRRRHRSPPPSPRLDCRRADMLNGCGEISSRESHDRHRKPDGLADHDDHEQFRLCFKQPFADLERLRSKLDSQRVCLENVRVDDWAATSGHHGTTSNSLSASSGPHHPSSMAVNSVILCSIQTKITGDHHDARVFARCTSDNWSTFADLPAQRVTGLDSLGLGYDRYCFAVRRPASPDTQQNPTADRAAASAEDRPSAAVEFAVCYEVSDCAFWDNNDDANYRIEWFRNVT